MMYEYSLVIIVKSFVVRKSDFFREKTIARMLRL